MYLTARSVALAVVALAALGCGRDVKEGFGLVSGVPGGLVAGISPGDKWREVEGRIDKAFELKDIDRRNKLLKAKGKNHTLRIKIELTDEGDVGGVLARLRAHGDSAAVAEKYVLELIGRLNGALDKDKTVCQDKPEVGCVWALVNEPKAPNVVFSWTGIHGANNGDIYYEAVNQAQLASYGKGKSKGNAKGKRDDGVATSFARLATAADDAPADGHLRIGGIRIGDVWMDAKENLDKAYQVSDLGATHKLLSAEGKNSTTTIAIEVDAVGKVIAIEGRMRASADDGSKLKELLTARVAQLREKIGGKPKCNNDPEVGCVWTLAATPPRPKSELSWAGESGEEKGKKWYEAVATVGVRENKRTVSPRSRRRRHRRRHNDGWGRF